MAVRGGRRKIAAVEEQNVAILQAERQQTMYHPYVDDQVKRIERRYRERRAAMQRTVRQLDAGRPSIWAQLLKRFQQVRARGAALPTAACGAADASASSIG